MYMRKRAEQENRHQYQMWSQFCWISSHKLRPLIDNLPKALDGHSAPKLKCPVLHVQCQLQDDIPFCEADSVIMAQRHAMPVEGEMS